MNVQFLIECVLNEALYRGPVGIDLEFLVRVDSAEPLNRLVSALGWNFKADWSVSQSSGTLEMAFYTPVEIDSGPPKGVLDVLTQLERILAWAKHEDLVRYDTRTQEINGKNPNRTLKLARGRTTSNLSGGCHLHFDVQSWFVSANHVQRFIKVFHDSKAGTLGQVLPDRYYSDFSSGNNFATFVDPGIPDYSKGPDGRYEPNPDWRSKITNRPIVTTSKAQRGLELVGVGREQALNFSKAPKRGDVEVRIFHSTLNISTIKHWFDMVSAMIDFTASEKHRPKFADYQRYIGRVDPELGAGMALRRQRLQKSGGRIPSKVIGSPFDFVTKATQKSLGGRSSHKRDVKYPNVSPYDSHVP